MSLDHDDLKRSILAKLEAKIQETIKNPTPDLKKAWTAAPTAIETGK